MKKIDLEEVKKQSVHDGILEAICLLRETRTKIYALLEDEDVISVIDAEDQLIRMNGSLCSYIGELCDMMGVLFSERADDAIKAALKTAK